MGNKLRYLLKIDSCTSATLRDPLVKIYVQVHLDNAVKNEVIIRTHRQKVIYECEGILCMLCGKLGHTVKKCPTAPPPTSSTPVTLEDVNSQGAEDKWQVIHFHKKRPQGKPLWPLRRTRAIPRLEVKVYLTQTQKETQTRPPSPLSPTITP